MHHHPADTTTTATRRDLEELTFYDAAPKPEQALRLPPHAAFPAPPGRGGPGGGGPGGARHRPRPRDSLPDDIAALTELKHHTKPVTCMCLDVANQQLYTGAQDGQVCAWSTASGQLVTAADVGMPVDTLLVEAGFLFVAVSQRLDAAIKVWNLGAGGAQQTLVGHTVSSAGGSSQCPAAGWEWLWMARGRGALKKLLPPTCSSYS